jgi:hypothetical protein
VFRPSDPDTLAEERGGRGETGPPSRTFQRLPRIEVGPRRCITCSRGRAVARAGPSTLRSIGRVRRAEGMVGTPGSRCCRAPTRQRVAVPVDGPGRPVVDQSPTVRARQPVVWPSSSPAPMPATRRTLHEPGYRACTPPPHTTEPRVSPVLHRAVRTDPHSRRVSGLESVPVARGYQPIRVTSRATEIRAGDRRRGRIRPPAADIAGDVSVTAGVFGSCGSPTRSCRRVLPVEGRRRPRRHRRR